MHKPIGRQTWRKICPDNKLGLEYATHRLNMELDLQSLFGLYVT
jgi:hypothetical protein